MASVNKVNRGKRLRMMPIESYKKLLREQLENKVTKNESGCWLWIGTTHKNGYGSKSSLKSRRKLNLKHRNDMKDHECTEQRFLDDVKNHQISIIKDDGLHRFIRFKRPDNSSYWFDLITWPGFLCISGDCGTYVFSRTEDMFKFFRMNDNDFNKKKDRLLNINPGYWGEKLEAIGRQGCTEFVSDEFEDKVKRCFESCFESENYSEEVKKELWEEIELEVIYYSHDEHEANKAANDFIYEFPDGEVFEFVDFFDYGSAERFTWHYIWCLYAIVWGIMKYDEAKND